METQILLFERFLNIIGRLIPEKSLSDKEGEALSLLNPDKIYVENIRSLLGVSSFQAVKICETAVRQGLFRRGVEVECPNGAVAASADTEEELPEMVRCWMEEGGHTEEVEVATTSLKKTSFYRLNDEVPN